MFLRARFSLVFNYCYVNIVVFEISAKVLISYHRIQRQTLHTHLRVQTAAFPHTKTSVWKGSGLCVQVRVQPRTLHNLIGKIVYDTYALRRCTCTSPIVRESPTLRTRIVMYYFYTGGVKAISKTCRMHKVALNAH